MIRSPITYPSVPVVTSAKNVRNIVYRPQIVETPHEKKPAASTQTTTVETSTPHTAAVAPRRAPKETPRPSPFRKCSMKLIVAVNGRQPAAPSTIRQGKPRAPSGKTSRSDIRTCNPTHRVGHHRPVTLATPAGNTKCHQESADSEVRQIKELHAVVPQRRGELFQPDGRLDARQPVIERQ